MLLTPQLTHFRGPSGLPKNIVSEIDFHIWPKWHFEYIFVKPPWWVAYHHH